MKLGLCLSGGGIKGAAHIGALRALEEENIRFGSVAGTSSGSIIATLYASGYSSDEMYKLFKKYANSIKAIDWRKIFKMIYGAAFEKKFNIDGINSGEIIEEVMNKACNFKKFYNINDFKKELLIPAIDSDSGKVYVFNSCKIDNENEEEKYISNIPIGRAVRASCSYPLVFSPCPYKEKLLLDGGIKENVPWKELRKIGCNKILSIKFKNRNKKKCCNNVIDIAERSFELLCEELDRHELKRVDFLHVIESNNVSLLQIEKMQELYEEGYIQTKRKIAEIKKYCFM